MLRNVRYYTIATMIALGLGVMSAAAAQNVPEGAWINLFDKESLFGWTAMGDVEWGVAEGSIVAEKGTNGILASTCQFMDFELSAKIKVGGQGSAGLAVRAALDGHPGETGAASLLFKGEKDAAWHEIQIKAVGVNLSATVDGAAVEGFSATRDRGHIFIEFHRYHGDKRGPSIEVSEVKLRPLQLTPLFNGQNLDGWNIIPDHASVFKVLDGAINITNGNGQIETAGTYQNFVLQLDIISNGDHLNSGVFFRGPVGVFWKGYESQVRNQWIKEDRGHPVDFGTGGLYGLQEARKVVSTDREWFQKTIVCDGNHMAVWINGYLVSDYFDTRPIQPDNDSKAGFVPGPGTIHLQGHDPTTDLSFKNINIQVYP